MRLPKPFAEKVRDGYQSTPDSARHHSRANMLAGLVAVGALLIPATYAFKHHDSELAKRVLYDEAAVLVFGGTLGIAIESSKRDAAQIPKEADTGTGQFSAETFAAAGAADGHNGKQPLGEAPIDVWTTEP